MYTEVLNVVKKFKIVHLARRIKLMQNNTNGFIKTHTIFKKRWRMFHLVV